MGLENIISVNFKSTSSILRILKIQIITTFGCKYNI